MKTKKESLKVISREQCPTCQDTGKDNVAIYEDGSKHCFGCNAPVKKYNFKHGEIKAITTRGLTYETCKHFDYQVVREKDGWTHIASYKNQNGVITGQKLRHPPDPETGKKRFSTIGGGQGLSLYGKWLWSPNDKLFITVTEGEIDALSIAQVQGYQYPVVSLPKGAGDARKALEQDLKYLLGFKYVVLAFDADDAGRSAVQKSLDLFEPGRVKVVSWPLKDANEMLLANREKEIKDCIFQAKEYRPEALVTTRDIIDKILIKPVFGKPYPWPSMTKITYGKQPGEIHIIVGSTGVGKTEFVKELIFQELEQNNGVGVFSFEQAPSDTMRRLVGAKLNVKLHLPGEPWDAVKIKEIAEGFEEKIYLYDKAGHVDTNDIFSSIRYLAKAKRYRVFIIDNIKALGIAGDNEAAEIFMNALKALMKELECTTYLLSHVAKDKFNYSTYVTTSPKNPDTYNTATAEDNSKLINKPGLEWETGRMPTTNNVEGSGIITALSNYVWGIARDSNSDDPTIKRTMRVKALKTRLDSTMTGKIFKLYYNSNGRLEESGSSNSEDREI